MADSVAAATSDGVPAWMVWGLGITSLVGYGTIYYSFGVLAPSMARDLGVEKTWIYAVFSIALLMGGLTAPWAGRAVDRFGAGLVMSGGTALAALLLVLLATSQGAWWMALVLVVLESTTALIFYDAAFAALVQAAGGEARKRITQITFIAGFASTIFWPVTAWLEAEAGWRGAYLAFAALNIAICLPIHLAVSRQHRTEAARRKDAPPIARSPVTPMTTSGNRRIAFVLAAISFAGTGAVMSIIGVHIIPTLDVLGLGASGLAIAALIGPSQVAGRFLDMVFGGYRRPVGVGMISATCMAAGTGLLFFADNLLLVGGLAAIIYGIGQGLLSIVRGALPLSLFGVEGYGTLLGRLAGIRLYATAAGPIAFSMTDEAWGIHAALLATVAIGMIGVVPLILLALRLRRG